MRLSVGISGLSLQDTGLASFAGRICEGANVEPGRLTFEVTETEVLADPEMSCLTLGRLCGQGFHAALVGLGSGGGPFEYLKECAFTYLKLDGSLVRDVTQNPINLAFVKVLSDCARHLEIPSVAGDIETGGTVKTVHGLGIQLAQGRYFGDWHAEPQW